MAQSNSLLAQRAAERRARRQELQDLRLNDTSAYVKTLSENAESKMMGASNRALSSSKAQESKKEKQPSRLMQEMAAMTAKMNRETGTSKNKEKEVAAREVREKDLAIKRQDKQNQQQNQNFKMVAGVFKEQTDKMLKAIKELGAKAKEQVAAAAEEGPTLTSLYEQYQEYKEKKKAEQEEAEKKKQEEEEARRPRRGRRRKRRGRNRAADAADDLDIEGHDDRQTRDRDEEKKRQREEKRNRRLERLRNQRGNGRAGFMNRARGFGSNLAGRASGVMGSLGGAAEGAGTAGRAMGALSTGAKVLGHVGAVASAVDAAYNAVPELGALFDSNESGARRAGAGAHLAIQGAGTVIGGVLGGVQGAAYGAEIGDKVADGAEWVGEQISGTKIGDAIGMAAAVAMTPFSEDAREAVVNDFKTNILPAFDKTFGSMTKTLGEKFDEFGKGLTDTFSTLGDKIGDMKDGAKNAVVNVFNGARAAAKEIGQGVSNAAGQIKDGYNKGGITGGMKAVKGTASLIGDGVANAGSAMKYHASKGTKSELDLALGFSANKGFKGMSDSQSKAYAANVMKTESGGKVDITNQYGFAGQYQFGADALADNGLIDKEKLARAKKAAGKDWYKGGVHKQFMEDNSNWKNEGGREAFLKDKTLQDNTFVNYTNKNIEAGYRSGALNAKSTPSDIAAYAKAAHLKGVGGANDYFIRGRDSADANGTTVSQYAAGAASSMNALAAKVDEAKAKGAIPNAEAKQLANADSKTGAKPDVKVAQAETPKAKVTAAGSIPTASTAVAATVAAPTLQEKMQGTGPMRSTVASSSGIPKGEGAKHVTRDQIDFVYQSQAKPMPTAVAAAQPIPMIANNVPAETQTVHVANQPAPPPEQKTVVARGPAANSGGTAPTLDEMPMFINDMGLVLLQTGHV